MCGIAGGTQCDKRTLARMLSAIRHRGPDGSGFFVNDDVGLGQVRLAVIDLTAAGRQPMPYRHGNRSATITFNGEVYNFQELRRELESLGYTFSSRTDTEVILAAYLQWDLDCVQRFNGMWAFAIYDPDRGRLFCSRDRFGKKPFYYQAHGGTFRFASELKSLLAGRPPGAASLDIDPDAVRLFFALGFVPSPFSIYREVRKLEAGHHLLFDLRSGQLTTFSYYEPAPYDPVFNRRALLEEGRTLLHDAVRLRLIADVPVGAFLSGGLDSSTVVGAMAGRVDLRNIHTFSIGFEGSYDESPYVELVKARYGTQHHHQYFRQADFDRLLPLYARLYDEPFGDFSGFPTYVVSQLARQYVTVCLSGDGGDEIFGGYPHYVVGRRIDLLRHAPRWMRRALASLPAQADFEGANTRYLLNKALTLSLEDPAAFYALARREDGIRPPGFSEWTTRSLRRCLDRTGGNLTEALRLHDLLYNALPDHYLVKVDRASMREALEVRSPFLDHRFVAFSQRIPTNWKTNGLATKRFMRGLVRDLVPREVLKRSKQGFTPPLAEWIYGSAYEPTALKGLRHLAAIDEPIARFYREKVMPSRSPVYTQYRIRLFLYGLWLETWRPEA